MDQDLEKKMNTAIWIANSLFERGKTSGSSANLSFIHNGDIYISGSGTCFGRLTQEEMSRVSLGSGKHIGGIKPSKELPLHRILYEKKRNIWAVIHTHSFYSTLWSCIPQADESDVMPKYTPYLNMKLGTVGLIPYAEPGSQRLFELFSERVRRSDGYLLANHGVVVGGIDLMSAFFALEELEESAHIAWNLMGKGIEEI